MEERVWRFPDPKGGSKRAFDTPICEAVEAELRTARSMGRALYAREARTWVFPREGGHISETKEKRTVLSHWGNDLRHTFKMHSIAAGVPEMTQKLLMNHKIAGVSARYIDLEPLWPALLEGQQKMADFFASFRSVTPE